MSEKMKAFLLGLADLMEEYGVELEVIETASGWESVVSGIDIEMRTPYETVGVSRYPDADELRKLAEKETP